MAIKVGFVSLGCPKNLLDTENMLYMLADGGFEIVPEDVDADVIIINTCAFIESAKQEAIDNILDVAWLKENHTLKGIVVTGCLAQRYKEEVLERMPEVDCVIGTGSIAHIADAVRAAYNGERYTCFEDVDAAPFYSERVITTPEYFAYLKIAEGCDNRCTYCVIPDIRGKFRSRSIDDIVAEAKDLVALGVKELCLVAQDTTRYGEDIYGTYCLDSLLQALSEIDGIQWIRLMYCYADRLTDSVIDEIANNPKVAKYIDLPLQHISDPVLKRMNRRDNEESIRAMIKKLRDRVPGITIRTTFITGFPGETEEDFEKLKSFIKEIRFERLGVFEYSREENTPAYDLPDQIPEKLKRRRYDILMKEQRRIHKELNELAIGKTLEVLCEGYDRAAEIYYGRPQSDAPDIDGKIYFSAPRRLKDGEMVEVEVTEVIDYDLCGRALKKE
ncbi:MAG: 30S ribosomal protein S12 methylthiotransferase RimO [Ruminococcaceae bacterium]|nr:30S ribosomal protein S12 methylthiotransferase RimO [Oscillospiraceae bacterium]